jgi:glycosyltransferase involved in cell wall biosynthesis
MRVLWFTNTPSLAAAHFNLPSIGGGWIESLEEKIKAVQNIELGIAFSHGKANLEKFSKDKTTYYAIPDKRSKVKKFTYRHLNLISNEELLEYCVEIINDFKPDIINVFGTEGAFGLISDRTKIPVVIHLQGIMTIYEKKWFSSGINKWNLLYHSSIKGILKGYSLIHHYYSFSKAAEREREIFKKCKYFMGRTDWDRRITAVLAPGSRYYCCDEILKKGFYRNVWDKKPQENKIFLSTIQPNIYKGLETVLETAILLKELDLFKFTWFVIGISNADSMVKVFEQKVGRKFKDFNIVFSGSRQSGDLINAELNADIFIHPSHIDNSPNSVCEAMLLGMPVLATHTGGTGSLLTDKKEGILIQDGDPYAMAGAVLDLIRDPLYAAELGRNARVRAIKRHDADQILNSLIDIYSGIINYSANRYLSGYTKAVGIGV